MDRWSFLLLVGLVVSFLAQILKSLWKDNVANRSIQGRMMGFVQDLFDEENQDGIPELMTKWKVSKNEFSYWLKDKRFLKEIRNRLKWARRKSEVFVAKYTIHAAAKLVSLTGSRNTETARRACLDILNFLREPRPVGRPPGRPKKPEFPEPRKKETLTEEQASAMLSSLASVGKSR